jgi:hypothetical protein
VDQIIGERREFDLAWLSDVNRTPILRRLYDEHSGVEIGEATTCNSVLGGLTNTIR